MRWFYRRLIQVRMLFLRGRETQRLNAELQYHLDRQIAENLGAGMSAEEARCAALRIFGNPVLLREQTRAAWSWNWLESIVRDLRYTLRVLAQSPGFTLTALITLTLAIGANTAIFSLLNAVLLRSLPIHEPRRLAVLTWTLDNWADDQLTLSGYSDYEFSYPVFERFAKQQKIFSNLFGFASLGFSQGDLAVTSDGDTEPATASMVTGGYFSGLGISPVAGRLLNETDLQPSAPRATVIAYAYWQRKFGGSFAVLGESIGLNGQSYTLVGVAPPGFTGLQPGQPEDLWIPVTDDVAIRPWQSGPPHGQSMFGSRQWSWLTVVGRLQPGVSPKQAQAALEPELAAEVQDATGTRTAPI
jgi:MacB-like periplasmic core domain